MPAALLLALLAASPLPDLAVRLQGFLALPGARLEVLAVDASGWPADAALEAVEVGSPIRASGRVAARLRGAAPSGAPCSAWAWVQVRVLAAVQVASREVAEGEPVQAACRTEEREVLPGRAPLTELPAGAVAARPLGAGQVLEARHLRGAGPSVGKAVSVLLQAGAIAVVQQGRAVPCSGGQTCAQLPNGKRVAGRFEGGQLVVEVP